MPSVCLNCHGLDNMSFETAFDVDRTDTDAPVSVGQSTSWRETLLAGYRWDFR